MDIVDELRADEITGDRQLRREARIELADLRQRAAAEIERLRAVLATAERDEARAELEAVQRSRDAAIDALGNEARLRGRTEMERDEARAALATARREALEEAAAVARKQIADYPLRTMLTDPDHADAVAAAIRCLKDRTP